MKLKTPEAYWQNKGYSALEEYKIYITKNTTYHNI